jgi:serine protease Do
MKATFRRPLIALAVASALAAGCTDVKVPGVADASAAAAQQQAAQSARQLPNFTSLVEQHGDAVVKIAVKRTQAAGLPQQAMPDLDEFFRHFGIPKPEGMIPRPQGRRPNPAPAQGVGSGFIISPDGTILTNAHVVDGASEVTVKLSDKRELEAKVVGVDPMTDIAVVKVDAKGLPAVTIGNPKQTKVGEWVAAIGSPFGMDHTVTAGIVSAKSRSLPSETLVPFIQTDVAVNPGNSGGPLFNMQGEVIGVNSQIYSTTGGYMGMSFAIPIDVAMKVKDQLVAHGKVTRGRMGVTVQELTPTLARSFGLEKARGALVSNVDQDGPAAKAGLQAGDVIVGFGGKAIEESGELPAIVADTRPGETVSVKIVRGGGERDLKLTVGEMPSQRMNLASGPAEQQGKLGVSVRSSDKGIVVEIGELKSAVDAAGGHVALLLQRGEARMYVPVPVG